MVLKAYKSNFKIIIYRSRHGIKVIVFSFLLESVTAIIFRRDEHEPLNRVKVISEDESTVTNDMCTQVLNTKCRVPV